MGGKWKYANEKKPMQDLYLRFEVGKTKTLTVTNWDFDRHPSGYMFKCFVEKEDGKTVDKVWTVWDYESAELLKKKLGAKYRSGNAEVTVTLVRDEDDEEIFEVA